MTSSRSSILLLDFARVAVLARARFRSMNSWSCFRFAAIEALVRWSCSRRPCWYSRYSSTLPGKRVNSPIDKSRVESHVALRKARSCETIKQASWKDLRKCSRRIWVRRSKKFVGSSSSSKFGSWSSRAESLTRVCQPPERFCMGDSSIRPLISNSPATSPHFQSGCALSRMRNSRAVSPGRNGSCCLRYPIFSFG